MLGYSLKTTFLRPSILLEKRKDIKYSLSVLAAPKWHQQSGCIFMQNKHKVQIKDLVPNPSVLLKAQWQ